MMTDAALLTSAMAILGAIKSCLIPRICQGIIRQSPNPEEFRNLRLIKFRISTWKSFYYTISATYGILILKDQTWLFDTSMYPYIYKNVPATFRVYYIVSFACYINEMINLLIEPRKKDFYEMVIHHIATLTLIGLSYQYGLVRYGVAVLLLHDLADPWLETAKVQLALRNLKTANVLFFIFALVFITTRLGIYPYFLVYPAVCHLYTVGACWSYLIAGMLCVLVLIHTIWACLIIRMARRIGGDKKVKDVRSEEAETHA